MQIILVGNYLPDKQESMMRFAEMLESGFQQQGIYCEIWLPTVFFGKIFKSVSSGFGKWLAYIDKWIIFPFVLRLRLLKRKYKGSEIRFHICDHSNSPYIQHLPKNKTSITCHDVIAIRAAYGYKDAYCPLSYFGKLLQKWILKNLLQVNKIACVSKLTLNQLLAFATCKDLSQNKWEVIHNAFNADFYVLDEHKTRILLKKEAIPEIPYILNVGSNLQRKNRKLLIDMLAGLGDKWHGNICYAGQTADKELLDYAEEFGLKNRVVSVSKPNHETLLALYNGCAALIFSSFSEGFGWTLIEAQACGCPVIASNIEPMPEVSNGTALHANPYEPKTFVDSFLSLQNPSIKKAVIRDGFENIKRFDQSQMIESYLKLFKTV